MGGQENKNHKKGIPLGFFCVFWFFSFMEYRNSIKTNIPLTSSPLHLRRLEILCPPLVFHSFSSKGVNLGSYSLNNRLFPPSWWNHNHGMMGGGSGKVEKQTGAGRSSLGTTVLGYIWFPQGQWYCGLALHPGERRTVLLVGKHVKFLCGTPAMGHFFLSLVSLRWENAAPWQTRCYGIN